MTNVPNFKRLYFMTIERSKNNPFLKWYVENCRRIRKVRQKIAVTEKE